MIQVIGKEELQRSCPSSLFKFSPVPTSRPHCLLIKDQLLCLTLQAICNCTAMIPSPSTGDTESQMHRSSTQRTKKVTILVTKKDSSPQPAHVTQHVCEVLSSQVYKVLPRDDSPTKAYYVQVLQREAPILKYSLNE